jgi:3-hydroxyacyl-[acyl-carrier-protein] dehydratase
MNTGTLISSDGVKATAAGTIESSEAFFQDHFPAFPVVPGVLMIELLKTTAEKSLKQEAPHKLYRLLEIRNVKYSDFLKPGEAWQAEVEKTGNSGEVTEWKGQLLKNGRPICTAKFKLVEKK